MVLPLGGRVGRRQRKIHRIASGELSPGALCFLNYQSSPLHTGTFQYSRKLSLHAIASLQADTPTGVVVVGFNGALHPIGDTAYPAFAYLLSLLDEQHPFCSDLCNYYSISLSVSVHLDGVLDSY